MINPPIWQYLVIVAEDSHMANDVPLLREDARFGELESLWDEMNEQDRNFVDDVIESIAKRHISLDEFRRQVFRQTIVVLESAKNVTLISAKVFPSDSLDWLASQFIDVLFAKVDLKLNQTPQIAPPPQLGWLHYSDFESTTTKKEKVEEFYIIQPVRNTTSIITNSSESLYVC
jgi:hypothetical protein